MGTEGGGEDPGLKPPSLADEPYRFDFIQAVRLLEAAYRAGSPVGHDAAPGEEAVRFSAHRDLGFPASQIHDLTSQPGKAPLMTVAFMGLTGPSGVLPTHYSELVIEETDVEGKPSALADFLDIFNHRLISFFYRGWERNHLHLASEDARSTFHGYLLSLVGESPESPSQGALGLLRHAGIWAQKRRSAEGLRVLLLDLLNGDTRTEKTPDDWIEVEILPFVARWIDLEESSRLTLSGSPSDIGLGRGAILGHRVRDWQGRFRPRIGPLTTEQFDRLQPPPARGARPASSAFATLVDLIWRYVGPEYDFEIVLVLRADQVPPCLFGVQDRSRLGRSWLLTREPVRDIEAAFRVPTRRADAEMVG